MILIKNGLLYEKGNLVTKDILIEDGKICYIGYIDYCDGEIIDASNCLVMPGAVDCHVHFREPGFEAKETVKTGSLSAAKGGFTTVLAMPNLNPYPDCESGISKEVQIIKKDAVIEVIPYGCITKGEKDSECADYKALKKYTRYLSDDGVGVNNLDLLKSACLFAKENNMVIASHAEDKELKYAPLSEVVAVKREIEIAKETGARYHFCHMSCKESFEAISEAQKQGYKNITCEVAPHHLFLNEEMINNNPNFKMNPPLRSEENRVATLEALLDGTAACIASDHAPHTLLEKTREYDKSPNGIIGLETEIPLVYTYLVKTGKASLGDLYNWFIYNPCKIFGLKPNEIKEGKPANLAILEINMKHKYREDEIESMGKNSPFIGTELYGFNKCTLYKGKVVWAKKEKKRCKRS